MSKVSISKAAKLAGVSRPHFYRKYINQGLISTEVIDDKPVIDIAELIRVFPNLKYDTDKSVLNETEHNSATYEVIEILKEQLKASHEREKWLMQQLEKTTHLLENKQPQETPKRKKFLGIF